MGAWRLYYLDQQNLEPASYSVLVASTTAIAMAQGIIGEKRQNTKGVATVIPVLILQLASSIVAIVFYEQLYSTSPYGASCLFSCLCSGLSQGIVQLFRARGLKPGLLFKFYVWGVLNGLWTVSNGEDNST